jgi:hypothetical protein
MRITFIRSRRNVCSSAARLPGAPAHGRAEYTYVRVGRNRAITGAIRIALIWVCAGARSSS